MKHIFKIILASLLFSGAAVAQLPDSLSTIFKYSETIVPKYTVDSTLSMKNVSVERIKFISTDSFVVSAYITHPAKKENSYPLIIFNHWSEGSKDEFLDEAISFSALGFKCILLDAPWLCPNSLLQSFTKQGFDLYRQNVMNNMKAIDLAQQQFKIDTGRIFFVGHSFGCNTAAILSAVEKRIGYFIFMAGVYSSTVSISNSTLPDFVKWRNDDPEQFKKWIKKMRPLDVELYLPFKTAPCLIQVANNDEYISKEENDKFINTTPDPKESLKYESTHSLNEQAREDRLQWIFRQLN